MVPGGGEGGGRTPISDHKYGGGQTIHVRFPPMRVFFCRAEQFFKAEYRYIFETKVQATQTVRTVYLLQNDILINNFLRKWAFKAEKKNFLFIYYKKVFFAFIEFPVNFLFLSFSMCNLSPRYRFQNWHNL